LRNVNPIASVVKGAASQKSRNDQFRKDPYKTARISHKTARIFYQTLLDEASTRSAAVRV